MTEKRKKTNIFPKIAIAALLIFLFCVIMSLRSQINMLKEEYAKIAAEVRENRDEVDELQYEFTLSEKEYIEKYVREKLGFHKTGEIVFKESNWIFKL